LSILDGNAERNVLELPRTFRSRGL
jgi:hypothetical protein